MFLRRNRPYLKSALEGDRLARTVSARVAGLLAVRKMTRHELAKKAGYSTSRLYAVLSGDSAQVTVLDLTRLSEALDVTPAYLMGGDTGA